ncbi:tRNA adenosine(34) deaminase TadA [bacterium]|nr:tRNA adenosine(34) deaminase TadA [bacterium]
MDKSDEAWMRKAIVLADEAAAVGEVPVGAVLVKDQELIGQGFNQPRLSHDPSAHAEIIALRDAALQSSNYRLPGTTLYVTIEPCTMCFGALIHARIQRVVIGALEPKAGAVISHSLGDSIWLNHRIEVSYGVLEEECRLRMREFFDARRNKSERH